MLDGWNSFFAMTGSAGATTEALELAGRIDRIGKG